MHSVLLNYRVRKYTYFTDKLHSSDNNINYHVIVGSGSPVAPQNQFTISPSLTVKLVGYVVNTGIFGNSE